MTGSILDRMRASAEHGPKLYHATRLLLREKPVLPPDGSAPPGWRSGLDPAAGWGEFLGNVEVFAVGEYERMRYWQQSCYYGSPDRVNEYTLLAGEALLALAAPGAYVDTWTFGQSPPFDRDHWTFVLYRVAMRQWNAMGMDIYGQSPYAGFVFRGLERAIACTADDRDRDLPMLTRFAEGYERGAGRPAEFLFGQLRLDVFAASVMALTWFVEHRADLYGSPDDLEGIGLLPGEDIQSTSVQDVDGTPSNSLPADAPGAERPAGRLSGRNEERDRWIYEQCLAGVKYRVIREELAKRAEGPDDMVSTCGRSGGDPGRGEVRQEAQIATTPASKGLTVTLSTQVNSLGLLS